MLIVRFYKKMKTNDNNHQMRWQIRKENSQPRSKRDMSHTAYFNTIRSQKKKNDSMLFNTSALL